MKLAESNISTSTSNMMHESSFGVGDMGIIFDILRNKLYQDPILAICREYACNARDAHREAGKPDLPIEIHLPNSFSAFLKIRDFGLGISPDRMENIFIKYASSTKRDDNVQTGGYGIGSKSAFAYTDVFSIITINNYVKRVYNAYIDETKIGKMSLAEESSTDESNGTTIVIPVMKKDFQHFISSVIDSTNFWEIKPILYGVSPAPEYNSKEKLLSGKDWCFYFDKDKYYRDCNTCAIIDGISYKIDSSIFSNYEFKLKNNFLLYFGNGELSLSASRDSIQYDEKTKKLLMKRHNEVLNAFDLSLKEKINNSSNYVEACLFLDEIKRIISYELNYLVNKSFTWHDNVLKANADISQIGTWAKLKCLKLIQQDWIIVKSRNASHQLVSSNTRYYLNDLTQENIKADLLKILFEKEKDTNIKEIKIISIPSKPTSHQYDVIKHQVPEYNLKFLNLFEPIKLSTIFNKTTRKNITQTSRKKNIELKCREMTNYGKKNFSTYITAPSGGVYLVYENKQVYFPDSNKNINAYYYLWQDLYKSIKVPIYVFDRKVVSQLDNNWISLDKFLDQKLQEIYKEIDFESLMQAYDLTENISSKLEALLKSINKFTTIKNKNPESLFLKCLEQCNKASSIKEKYNLAFTMLLFLNKIIPPSKKIDYDDQILDIYPMLKILDTNCINNLYYTPKNTKYINDIINYINMVDTFNNSSFSIGVTS